jgi:hypothetical protein
MTRISQLLVSPRSALGAALASAVLIGAWGVALPSGATTMKSASPSAFCKTLLSLSKVHPPATTNASSYKKWLKTYLPYYKTLASQAPKSAKGVLTELVTVMQYEVNTTNPLKLNAYIATHSKQWVNGWKAFTTTAIGCATSMYG